jgi:hypothetical protein
MSSEFPVLARFLATGALASVIGGFLVSNQWGRLAESPVTQASRSSPEMMQLMRDEHGLVANMIRAQLAAERRPLPARTALGKSADRDGTAIVPARTTTAR